ncbi:hypothetical protein K8T06_00760, partial [bacterium]|nr:hypothetical protein [bacterium]
CTADWDSRCIDCPPKFYGIGPDVLQCDGAGNQVLAAGGDNLHVLHKNGSTWDLEIVDDSPAVGSMTSMKVDSSGYAHISYRDSLNDRLKYARETSSGWSIETLDTTRTGNSTSLILDVSDYPRIAYSNSSASNKGLYYTYFDGSSWHYETVQNEHAAYTASIAINAQNDVSIAYFDSTDSMLKYAVRDGGNWTIETLVTESDCGGSSTLVMDNMGLPHILYECSGLKHTWHNGTDWQTEQLISTQTQGISLEYDSGNILHASWTTESVIQYSTWDGTSWSTETVVTEAEDEMFGWCSLLLTPGNTPEIAYLEAWSYKISYCVKNGSTWESSHMVRGGYTGGYGSSAQDQSGYSHASYTYPAFIERFRVLNYAWEDAQGWHKTVIDDESYVYDTFLDLDSNGAAHIGYYTLDPDAYKYATNASGSWVITTVALDAGEYCRLKVDASDHVHTVFRGAWESYYGYFDGATWKVETLEPITGSIDGHFGLCISDDETPHISFLNGTDMNLGYGYRTTNGWQFDMNIDTHYLWWVGEYTSIALTSQGYPIISYYQTQYDNHLRLASWDGTQWEIEIFDAGPQWGGSFSSLKIDSNDFAYIACYGENEFLYYFEAEDGWHVSNGLPCGLQRK